MKHGGVRLIPCIPLLLLVSAGPLVAVEIQHLSIDASKAGAKIDRNLFGQFAENLGHGLYGGIWIGPDSAIPNTRGIRNDVVIALRALHVPNVRWPGGCFGDEYHWRKGVGPPAKRPATLNSSWGGVVDDNSFGTAEFMDFVQQIGSQAYVSINVGSGTPQEAAEWLEYMTAAQPTSLARERAANGHPDPYSVPFLGIGNESWGCGGNMSADYYLSQLKIYSHFVRNDNPSQRMLRIAVWPGHSRDRVDRHHHESLAASQLELEYRRAFAALVHGGEWMAALDAIDKLRTGGLRQDAEIHAVHE